MTVFRALKQHGYFTSFNHNARYYTLADKPQFAPNGLWFYRSIGFSRHGSLTQTLVALVRESAAGATPEDLTHLLRTPVGNLLARLAGQAQLARQRIGRRVFYLASDPQRQEEQWRHRQQPDAPSAPAAALPAGVAATTVLPLLAELIRFPCRSVDQLTCALLRQGVLVDASRVQTVLAFYQLEKKEAR